MKKLLAIALSLLMLLASVYLLVSCGDNEDNKDNTGDDPNGEQTTHTHTYAKDWTGTKAGHYKACICHPEVIELASHTDTVNSDGVCDVCLLTIKESTTFKVTVKDDKGNPVPGVVLKIFTSFADQIVTTDENGVAEHSFIYYDSVKAIIQSVPQGYENLVDEIYEFEGTELNIEMSAIVYFEVYVLDENEQGVSDITVSFMSPFKSLTTDENGYVRLEVLRNQIVNGTQLFYIPTLPEEYYLTDFPLNSLVQISDNSAYTVHVGKIEEYSLSARDDDGEPLANALFVLKKDGEVVAELITDENGNASILLPKGEYTVEISHLCAFFSTDEATVTLTSENRTHEAIFKESTDMETIWIEVSYDDGTPATYDKVQVIYFKKDTLTDVNLLGVNSHSKAATNNYNEDYIFYAYDKNGGYGYAYYTKNGPTTIKLVMKKDVVAGSTEEHAVPINMLLKLPYAPDAFYLPYDRSFAKGESIYIKVINAIEKTVTLNGNLFKLEYKGQEITPDENGVISITFNDVLYGEDAVFKITALEDATEDLTLDLIGTMERYITVNSNKEDDLVQSLTLHGIGQEKYFYFVSHYKNNCKVTVTAEGADVIIEYPDGDVVEPQYGILIKIIANGVGDVTLTFTAEELSE